MTQFSADRVQSIGIDIETYCEANLSKVGVYRYAEDPSFEILLFAYSINGGPVEVIDCTKDEIPNSILNLLINDKVAKYAYNASFERVCLSRYLFGVRGMPDGMIPPTNWHCTMVKALYNGLPASLEHAAAALGNEQKDKRGKQLIGYFSIPCKPTMTNGLRTRNLPEHAPEAWQEFIEYCRQDVVVERDISKSIKDIPENEQRLYEIDQCINDTGILIDTDLANGAIAIDNAMKDEVTTSLYTRTGLENPKSNVQFKKWVEERIGRPVDSIDKNMVSQLKEEFQGTDLAAVLSLKQQVSKTSTTKYQTMLDYRCSDGRVRGLLQFYGANRTGRWAGRGIQVHNLPQNHMPYLDQAISLVKTGDYESMKMVYEDKTQQVLSELIRTAFVAPKGRTFVVCDFSAIEARVLSWIADERWRLDVFKEGKDIYCASASAMFGVPVEKHGQNAHLRQKGKIAELALGYQGGVGALKQMGGEDMGLTEPEMAEIVDKWRHSNPMIQQLWYEVNTAAINAVKGQTCSARGILFGRDYKDLYILLPSRRRLVYRQVSLGSNNWGGESIVYKEKSAGSNQGLMTKETYGGKLVENIIQAIARDCLAVTMARVNQLANAKIVMHVHDEIVMEVPDAEAESVFEKVKEIFAEPIPWAPGLLLRGDGYITPYYKKD